jgi:hypothetical protein
MDNKRYRIRRDNDKDISFQGELIGTGDYGTGGEYKSQHTRGTEVEIYLTHPNAKLVTAVRQWSQWQGEEDVHRAAVHDTPAEAYAWLVEDCGGKLGRASKEAWDGACEVCELLAGADVEEVA